MGNNNSKLEFDSLEAILGFKPLSQFTNVFDLAIALKCVASKLMLKVKSLTSLKLSEVHRRAFEELEVRKVDILREICVFVMFIEFQIKSIKYDIDAKKVRADDVQFAELTYGSEGRTVAAVLREYSNACMALSRDYDAFRKTLEAGYYFDEKAKKIIGWFGIVGGVLAAAAAIFLSAGLAAPAVAVVGSAAGLGVFACGAITCGCLMVTDGEATRATRYLQDVAKNLRQVGMHLGRIRQAYEPTNHATVMLNIDSVLDLTHKISTSIEIAIVNNFEFGA